MQLYAKNVIEKFDEVSQLVKLLTADFYEKNLLPPRKYHLMSSRDPPNASYIERNATLERLKLYTRDVEDADPLFTEEVWPPTGSTVPH